VKQKTHNIYNKILKMTNETLRMQMLAGIITESEYKDKLNEGIKQWVIPFAMAGAIALGIAQGVSNTNDRNKWEAAYEKIKIEHPIEAEKIHDLLIKWDNTLGPKPGIIQLKKQTIGQDLDKLIKSIELDDKSK
jgi:hypothetical protein